MRKRMLSLALVILFMLGLLPVTSFMPARAEAVPGSCSSTWQDDGTLIIAGKGNVGDFQFSGVSEVKKLVVQAGITSIGYGAFCGCENLESIEVQGSWVSLSDSAFADCTALKSVSLSSGVYYIGYGTFSGCTSLTDVNYGGSASDWADIIIKENNTCLTYAQMHNETLIPQVEPADGNSYITFGSYPQAEVVSSLTMICSQIEPRWLQADDVIVDAVLYSALQSSTGWANDTITMNGEKYCRVTYEDGTRYFKYQPIRWRVVRQDDSSYMLVSEKLLDKMCYGKSGEVNWYDSDMRSWLNSYDAEQNASETDYSSSGFLSTAFTPEEQASLSTEIKYILGDWGAVTNAADGSQSELTDRVFLLSSSDAVEFGLTSMDDITCGTAFELSQGQGFDWAVLIGTQATEVCTVASSYGMIAGLFVDMKSGVRPAICLSISNPLDNDYDGDGSITLADVSLLYHGLTGTAAIDLTNADVNGDGQVSLRDVAALFKLIHA